MSVKTPRTRAFTWRGLGGRLVVPVLIALGLAAMIIEGVLDARKTSLVSEGVMAPAFQAERYGGGAISLAELRGKVVMLDFWATWCHPCRQEFPILVKLTREYESKGLVFVAANQSEDPVSVGEFLEQLPPLSPNVTIALTDVETSRRFQVHYLPTLYFIGRDGKVLDALSGAFPEVDLRARVEKALSP